MDLVFATALRRCAGDRGLAEDVTQIVFADLTRKALGVLRDLALTGWLHRHTLLVASAQIRAERRCRQREVIAMRANRALEPLRQRLARRGLRSSAAACAALLTQQGTMAARAGLAASAAASAMAQLTTTAGILHAMTASKLTTGIASIGAAGVEHDSRRDAEARLAAVQAELEEVRVRIGRDVPPDEERAGMEEKLRLELVRLGDRSARLREAEQTIARLRQENAQLQAEMQQAAAAMMQVLREAGERIPEQGEWKAIGIARMNLKVWATAIHEYARAHGQAMPA